MAGWFSTAGANSRLDAVNVSYLSLHTAEPNPADPAASEYGGAGYSRQSCSFDAADEAKRELSEHVVFTGVPEASVTWLGFWVGAVFDGASPLTGETEFDAATGMLVVLAEDTYLGLT
jgi:hypothetical protein